MTQFNKIAQFGQRLMLEEDIEKALNLIADEAKSLVDADRCSLFIVDKEDKMLWTKLSDGIGRIVISLDSGIVGDTYTKKEPQIVNDPYNDERFLPSIDKKSGYVTKNIITIPIFNSRREVMGIMQLLNKCRDGFDEKDLEMLTFLANFVSGSLELALLKEAA
jgi:GAF domain-containing protein